jgi:hypothetical protein
MRVSWWIFLPASQKLSRSHLHSYRSWSSCWTQSFSVTVSANFNWGKIYDIFSPLCLHIFPPRPCNKLFFFHRRCTGGKYSFPLCQCFPPVSMFFPLAMLYGIYFTFLPRQLLGYELEEKQCNISPLVQFFPTCDRKTRKKLMEERNFFIFFPISIFFPLGPCCIWFPFSDNYGIEVHENDDFYPWLNCTVHCSACKLQWFCYE